MSWPPPANNTYQPCVFSTSTRSSLYSSCKIPPPASVYSPQIPSPVYTCTAPVYLALSKLQLLHNTAFCLQLLCIQHQIPAPAITAPAEYYLQSTDSLRSEQIPVYRTMPIFSILFPVRVLINDNIYICLFLCLFSLTLTDVGATMPKKFTFFVYKRYHTFAVNHFL